jgi:hypothetical protein
MTLRRTRLSIEPLEDRTNPATGAALSQQVFANGLMMQELAKDMSAAMSSGPALRSFITHVHNTAVQAQLDPSQSSQVSALARLQDRVARFVASRIGLTLSAPVVSPPTPPPATGGAPSVATSTVGLNPASVPVGGTSTVTLTAKNAAGTNLTAGGAAVLFSLGSTTGGQGTFSTVTDNDDGTYTATFTATTAGTNTVRATINGQQVTTTAPTITVTAAATTPSLSQSTVAASPASVPVNGTSQVTLTAKDASGAALTTGGAAVLFGLGSTTGGQGTFGQVTDNNNGTYTATFTATTAGTNTITATIGGQPVTSTAPTITVTAASTTTPSLSQSTVAASPASVPVNGTSQVTLTAKDASGTALTTGGATVLFGLGSATGGLGTFGNVTDNGDGTYTATFTASQAGTNTITATINGTAVTSTAPTITVTAAAAGGTPSVSQSTVAVSPTSVAVGGTPSQVTLTARDASGTALTTGGATVLFGLGSATGGLGTFGTVTDNGNGTYTAAFTGSTAGTNTITATINGTAVTSTAPTIIVTPAIGGTASPGDSTVAVSPTSIVSGETATVTLKAFDATGTALTTGGSLVTFGLGTGGTGQGTFDPVLDQGDGTYTAVFHGTDPGSNTIVATLDGQPVTTAAPTITIL